MPRILHVLIASALATSTVAVTPAAQAALRIYPLKAPAEVVQGPTYSMGSDDQAFTYSCRGTSTSATCTSVSHDGTTARWTVRKSGANKWKGSGTYAGVRLEWTGRTTSTSGYPDGSPRHLTTGEGKASTGESFTYRYGDYEPGGGTRGQAATSDWTRSAQVACGSAQSADHVPLGADCHYAYGTVEYLMVLAPVYPGGPQVP